MSAVIFTAKCAKTANKKNGVSPGSLWIERWSPEPKAVGSNPARRVFPLSGISKNLPSPSHATTRGCAKPEKVLWPVSLCSCRSRCSRFMEFKRSVCCISDGKITAKHAKIANKKRECPLEFFRPSTESLLDLRRESPNSLSVKKNGESAIILTAKCVKTAKVCMVNFSLFVPFALFAVHVSKTVCPL